MKEGYVLNPESGRIISKKTAKYRRLVKLGVIAEDESKEIEKPNEPTPKTVKFEEPVLAVSTAKQLTPEFDERDLQVKMAELTTDMVADNMKKIVRSQKLSDAEYDTLLKKMLYQKLCIEPKKPAKKKQGKKKGKKYKIVEPSESESESDSD